MKKLLLKVIGILAVRACQKDIKKMFQVIEKIEVACDETFQLKTVKASIGQNKSDDKFYVMIEIKGANCPYDTLASTAFDFIKKESDKYDYIFIIDKNELSKRPFLKVYEISKRKLINRL